MFQKNFSFSILVLQCFKILGFHPTDFCKTSWFWFVCLFCFFGISYSFPFALCFRVWGIDFKMPDIRTQTQVLTPDMKRMKQPSKEQDTSSMKRIRIIYNDPMPLIVRVTMMRNIMGSRIDQRIINALFQRLWLGLPLVNHLQRLYPIAISMGDDLLILRSSMTVTKLKNPLSCIRDFGIENQENMQWRFEIRFERLEYGLALILVQRRLLLLFRKRGSSLIMPAVTAKG